MPIDQVNSGSFMAPAGGGGNPIAEALNRRGMTSPLNQVGPAAPTAPTATPPTQVPSGAGMMPQGSPTAPRSPQTAGIGGPQAPTVAPDEAVTIVKALAKRLSDLTTLGK